MKTPIIEWNFAFNNNIDALASNRYQTQTISQNYKSESIYHSYALLRDMVPLHILVRFHSGSLRLNVVYRFLILFTEQKYTSPFIAFSEIDPKNEIGWF